MKQRMRKRPLYRLVREAKLAEMLGLVKKIAATLPAPPVHYDEYHKIPGNLPSQWTTGHARAINH